MPRLICVSILLSFFILHFLIFNLNAQTKDTTSHKQHSSVITFSVQKGDTAVVTVYNMLGKYVVQKSFCKTGSFRLSLNVFHLPAGIYLVRIKTSHESIVKKAFVMP